MSGSSYMFLESYIASIGGLCFGYSNGIISGLLQNEAFRQDFGINGDNEVARSGSIAAALQFGGLFGVAFQSSLNDILGRKFTCVAMAFLYLIGGYAQVCADSSIETFLVGRFIAGFSLSIWTVGVSLYNAEISSTEARGKIIGIQQLSVAFGMCCGFWLNFIIHSAKLEYELALGGQVLFGVLAIMLFAILPESPRWLVMHNHLQRATRSLAVMRTEDSNVEEEIQEIARYQKNSYSSSWKEVFSTRNQKKLQVCLLFVLFQQFAGQNLLFYYAPSLFKDLGLKENELLATGFLGVVKLLMTIPSLLVIDNLGRRPLMLIGTLIMILSFLYIGIYNTIEHPSSSMFAITHSPFKISFFAWLAIISIYIFVAGYSVSWGVVRYVLPAETFPQSIRAKANTLCQLVDWAFQVVGIKLSPYLMSLFQGQIYFLFSGLLLFFLCWLWYLPETKGVQLEEMDAVFNPDHETSQSSIEEEEPLIASTSSSAP